MDVEILGKVFLVILGLQTASGTPTYEEDPASWQNATTYCRSLGKEVSCPPYSVEKKVWINIFKTFSAWFRLIGCTQDIKIENTDERKILTEDGNAGSCQIACHEFEYFITKQGKCRCVKEMPTKKLVESDCTPEKYSIFQKEEKSISKDKNDDVLRNPKTPCEYLYCNKTIPKEGLLVANLNTACKYKVDQFVAICGIPGTTHECLNYTQFQRNYGSDDIKTNEIQCEAYQIDCRHSSQASSCMVKSVNKKFIQQIGVTSTLVHNISENIIHVPVVACGYLNPSSDSGNEIGFHWGNECKQQNMPFFCDTVPDDNDLTCYKNFSAAIMPKEIHLPRTTTVAAKTLRTLEESADTTSTGAIAGAVVGVCLITVIAVIAIVIVAKRLRRSKSDKTGNEQNGGEFSQVTPVTNTAYDLGIGSISNSSEYDYIKEPHHYKTNTGYEDLEDNKDYEYSDNSAYDHLHEKGERKINPSEQNNLYSHRIPGNDDSTYDIGNIESNSIDHSTYNTTNSDDYNKLDIRNNTTNNNETNGDYNKLDIRNNTTNNNETNDDNNKLDMRNNTTNNNETNGDYNKLDTRNNTTNNNETNDDNNKLDTRNNTTITMK